MPPIQAHAGELRTKAAGSSWSVSARNKPPRSSTKSTSLLESKQSALRAQATCFAGNSISVKISDCLADGVLHIASRSECNAVPKVFGKPAQRRLAWRRASVPRTAIKFTAVSAAGRRPPRQPKPSTTLHPDPPLSAREEGNTVSKRRVPEKAVNSASCPANPRVAAEKTSFSRSGKTMCQRTACPVA